MASSLESVQDKSYKFDLKNTKFEFVKTSINFVKTHRFEECWPCTPEQVSNTKYYVLEGKNLLQKYDTGILTHKHKRLLKKYDIEQKNIKQCLVTNDERRTQVINVFMLFDIICEAHIEKEYHRDFQATQAALNPKYYVPNQAIEIFLTVCNVCQTNSKLRTDEPNKQILNTFEKNKRKTYVPKYRLCAITRESQPQLQPQHLLLSNQNTSIVTSEKPESTPNILSGSLRNIRNQHNHGEKSTDTNNKTVPQSSTSVTTSEIKDCDNSVLNNVSDKVKVERPLFIAHKIVFVNVIAMEMDGDFVYLLIYMDKLTKYTLLRPLISLDMMEMAMVIFKIFSDFGKPDEIISLTPTLQVLKDAINLLHLHFCFENIRICPVSRQELQKDSPINIIERKVRNRLRKWSIVTKSKNWGIGCYIVQLKMNQEKMGTNPTSPFKAFFSNNIYTTNSKKNISQCDVIQSNKQPATEENQNQSDSSPHVLPASGLNRDEEQKDIKLEHEIEKHIDQSECNDIERSKTTQIINQDNLDAEPDSKSLQNKLDTVTNNTSIKRTSFEKSFESFATRIKKVRYAFPESGQEPPVSTANCDTEELANSNQVLDSDDCVKCHVCLTELDSKQKINYLKCSDCQRRIHSLCSSTRFKERDQTICLFCIFKDGGPENSIANFSDEIIICD